MIQTYYGDLKIGEIYREDLITSEEASNRLADIRKLLLGYYHELVETVTEQEQRIVEQNETIEQFVDNSVDKIIEQQTETIQEQSDELANISQQVDEINNEVI